MIILKRLYEIKKMALAGRILGELFEILPDRLKEGVSTFEIDKFIEEFIFKNGARPAFKGYEGYSFSSCISINNEIIHGLPSKNKIIKSGDIVSIDVGTVVDGYYGDAARTYIVDTPKNFLDEKLVEVTFEALEMGIKNAVVGKNIGDVSYSIQNHVETNGFSVVRDFVGHGVGRKLHEDPQVPNYGTPGTGAKIMNGMTLALEPMVCQGDWRIDILSDGWTVVTLDGKNAAHFEDTIAIVDGQPLILTRIEGGFS
ncbi:MAG: methionyl aminopeptidase [Thermotogaceae bacterium]|nr:methionyl aminopeptidase [Thermotogaceae bacterium]